MSQRSSSVDSGDSSDSEPVELNILTRERRSNAANRYDPARVREVVEAGDGEDELAMLFEGQDVDDDEEFAGSDEEEGDNELDSSSDDDDQGPDADGEGDEGEKELKKVEKTARAQKRKAASKLTSAAARQKKVRIDPRAAPVLGDTPTARPAKKKERISQVAHDAIRASSRKQTLANKEETQAKMAVDEEMRQKHKAKREKRDRERQQERRQEMTQADRLAEAEKTERRNAKSLNRWETMEKKRVEEQAAKLAALKNRKLEGPVISLWSGVAKWVAPRISEAAETDPSKDTVTEAKKRGRKTKAYHEQVAAAQRQAEQAEQPAGPSQTQDSSLVALEAAHQPESASAEDQRLGDATAASITFTAPQGPSNFLDGIHEAASLPGEVTQEPTTKPADTNTEPEPEPIEEVIPIPEGIQHLPSGSPQPMEMPAASPVVEYATRNLVGLEDFDGLSREQRHDFAVFFNSRKSAKPVRQIQELCPITALPARYRDPSTAIAYANGFAYRKLLELKRQEHTWSIMLGCYVGRAGFVARGVPEGFLG